LNTINNHILNNSPHITFISYSLPRFDKTSSELRQFNLLKILLKNKCEIDYLYSAQHPDDRKYAKILKGNIRFKYFKLDQKSYLKSIADQDPDYVWITELWRLNYIRSIVELTCRLRKLKPSFNIIVDTIDFHYKEFYRKYEISNNPDDLESANDFLENESVLYKLADTVIVISEEEEKDIQDKISGIRKLQIVPNIHKISDSVRPYSKREHICFVGNFGNNHNIDAVRNFIDNIFPLILNSNPLIEFHVIGYRSNEYRKAFRSPNVKVIGPLKYLDKALLHYKLFVCPMTYGAGMKGKIGSAIAAGIPVVSTTIGTEGFLFRDGEECFIADSAEEFADKCIQCLSDPILWHNFSVKSRLKVAESSSPAVVAEKLKNILSK
jgi:glycosyltransferase involved in cell wall biosynthesis